MEIKRTGISRELLIHPGETIADVLENRGITQNELALRAGVTAAYVNKVIKGEKDISAKFAMGLEYALGVHKSFWLNLQADYDAEYLEVVENETVREDELKLIPHLDEICKYFVKKKEMPKALNDTERVIWLRHILGLSNIASVYEIAEEGTFKMEKASDIDEAVLGAWIRLCQKKCEFHCTENRFDPSEISVLLDKLKILMKEEISFDAVGNLMKEYGIDFAVVPSFKGASADGFVSYSTNGTYKMAIALKSIYADRFWFTLFHELGHIVNGDVPKRYDYLDNGLDEKEEMSADEFALMNLIDSKEYCSFADKGDFSIECINAFATVQNIPPWVVLGRLRREKRINHYFYNAYTLKI